MKRSCVLVLVVFATMSAFTIVYAIFQVMLLQAINAVTCRFDIIIALLQCHVPLRVAFIKQMSVRFTRGRANKTHMGLSCMRLRVLCHW